MFDQSDGPRLCVPCDGGGGPAALPDWRGGPARGALPTALPAQRGVCVFVYFPLSLFIF